MLFVVILFLTQNIYSQNSENITQIGLWENDSCLAVSVADTLAYLAAGTKGMYIIDVSNPSVPEKIGSIKSSKGGKAIGVKVSGVFAYVLYDKTPISYMQIVDITDPTFPIDVATIEIEKNIYDLAVDSSHVYIAGLERMHIVDISNKETPIEVGSFNTEYSASSVEVKDSYVYLTDLGWSYGKVRIIDVANPFAPEEKSYIVPRNDGGPYTATISESSLFVSWITDSGSGFFEILDISNPSSPIEKKFSSTFGPCISIAVEDPYAFLAIDSYGLQMLDINNLPHYSWDNLVGYFKTADMPIDVAVDGSYVYLVDGDDGLYILQNNLLVNVEESNSIPQEFILEQNYPNPFNPTTKIKYQIAEKRMVTLKVYNMLGQEVSSLVNEIKSAGKHSVTFDANNLPSGMYIYHIESGNYTESKKILLLK